MNFLFLFHTVIFCNLYFSIATINSRNVHTLMFKGKTLRRMLNSNIFFGKVTQLAFFFCRCRDGNSLSFVECIPSLLRRMRAHQGNGTFFFVIFLLFVNSRMWRLIVAENARSKKNQPPKLSSAFFHEYCVPTPAMCLFLVLLNWSCHYECSEIFVFVCVRVFIVQFAHWAKEDTFLNISIPFWTFSHISSFGIMCCSCTFSCCNHKCFCFLLICSGFLRFGKAFSFPVSYCYFYLLFSLLI